MIHRAVLDVSQPVKSYSTYVAWRLQLYQAFPDKRHRYADAFHPGIVCKLGHMHMYHEFRKKKPRDDSRFYLVSLVD